MPTCQMLVSHGPIPKVTHANGKKVIQDMAEHSQMWHECAFGRSKVTGNSEGLAAITAKIDKLGREITKVTEKVHAI